MYRCINFTVATPRIAGLYLITFSKTHDSMQGNHIMSEANRKALLCYVFQISKKKLDIYFFTGFKLNSCVAEYTLSS